MATIKQIADMFLTRIANDSASQLEKAGDIWAELPFKFFYLTHADDTVDIVVKRITEQIAEEDDLEIPDFVFDNLKEMVGPKTVVKEAIRLVFLTTFKP